MGFRKEARAGDDGRSDCAVMETTRDDDWEERNYVAVHLKLHKKIKSFLLVETEVPRRA